MLLSGLIFFAIGLWHIEDVPVASTAVALDIDPYGMAAVVFWSNQDMYFCYRCSSGGTYYWLWEYINSAWDENFKNHDNFCFDNIGKPHVTFFRPELYRTPERYIFYATREAIQQWTSINVGDMLLYGEQIDISTDTFDYPHIIYGRYHTYYDGMSWQYDTVNSIVENAQPSLAIDHNNTIHISLGGCVYEDTGFVGYGYKDSDGWHVEYNNQYDVNSPVKLAVDSAGRPHLLFCTSNDSLTYHAMKQNNAWIYEDITALNASFIDISDTTVHLLGTDPTGNTIRHYWKLDSDWLFEDIHSGMPLDLAVDKDDYVHCIFYENNQLHYATNRPQTVVSEQIQISLETISGSRITRLPVRINFLKSQSPDGIDIVNNSGRAVASYSLNHGANSFMWNGRDQTNHKVPTGIYYLIQKKHNQHQITKIILVK